MERDCAFCRIARGESNASIIFEDDAVLAFVDIRPVNQGHSLVIPRRHATYLADLDADDGPRLFRAGERVAAALRRSGLRCEGVNFYLADGAVAGQEVFHVHLHVIPRFEGDGFGLRHPLGYGTMTPREDLDAIASKIRDGLG
jgi:diadenosine tetraphosphate (Ap4A) HIT family hydrolase